MYWDSVYKLARNITVKMPYCDVDHIQLMRVGNLVTTCNNVKFVYTGQCDYSTAVETIPYGYRPKIVNTCIMCGNVDFSLYVDPDGIITMLGNPNSAYTSILGVWYTSNDFPEDDIFDLYA